MNDKSMTISELRELIHNFSLARGWVANENPKDFTMALAIEAAEIMEIFQWVHSDDADSVKNKKEDFEHLKEEIADVFWYLIRLCNHFDVDLSAAVMDKADKNAEKYPAIYY